MNTHSAMNRCNESVYRQNESLYLSAGDSFCLFEKDFQRKEFLLGFENSFIWHGVRKTGGANECYGVVFIVLINLIKGEMSMIVFKKTTRTLGMSLVALVALSLISCGKKSSGGGSATAPVCDANGTCTVGQTYASGVYFRTGVGQAAYYNNQNIIARFAFFGKDSAGLNMSANPVTYNGTFDVTGTVRVGAGAYTGVSSLATRNVSNISLSLNAGVSVPQLSLAYSGSFGNGGSYAVQYNTGGSYYLPCGYNSTNCNGGGYYPQPQPCTYQGCTQYPPSGGTQCIIPAGDYSVSTTQSGNFVTQTNYYGNSESFNNLKIRFQSGSTVVDATYYNGTLTASNSGSTSNHIMRGTLVINTINGQQCNQALQLQ